MKKIFIEISRNCDKDCYYCYNSKKGKKDIVPETHRILDSIKNISKNEKEINLTFSGGEPTNKISEIIDILLKLKEDGFRVTPALITNTESLNQEFYKFAITFKPFIVLSYNKKTTTLLRKLNSILPSNHLFVRFTITPKNVKSIYKDINSIISENYYIGISPAYGIEWNNSSLLELKNLYSRLIKMKGMELIYDFEKILHIGINKDKICKSLKEPNAIDINGKIYPCHRAIYFPQMDILKGRFDSNCIKCKAKRFCIPCVFKDIPGDGCKIRIAISNAYEILLNRRSEMKKKVKILYKGKRFEVPEAVLKKYSVQKKKNPNRKNNRNFYELGESDCY